MTYGRSRSIQDLVGIMRQHFPTAEVEYVERDKLMPSRGTLSVKKAAELLGYAPKYPLEVGFTEYIKWYQSLDFPPRSR
jgi:nucleoside-diphosphate-sugar epimerase